MGRSRGASHQFTLARLFGLTALSAVVFAAFRWLGLEPRTSLFVVAVLVVALAGAVSLVVAIGRYGIEHGEQEVERDGATASEQETGG